MCHEHGQWPLTIVAAAKNHVRAQQRSVHEVVAALLGLTTAETKRMQHDRYTGTGETARSDFE